MKIVIETIPHSNQRYNTCGDWQWEGDTLHIKVSSMKPQPGYSHLYAEMIIGIHEAIEALCCLKDDVSERDVDTFDNDKKLQSECYELEIESGDHPKAPYKKQHLLATGVEKILCVALGVPWFEYEAELIQMTEEYDRKHV